MRPPGPIAAARPITIDGREGWLIESDITVTAPGLAFPGDRAIFVVVRDGDDWGMFFGAVPIGDVGLKRCWTVPSPAWR